MKKVKTRFGAVILSCLILLCAKTYATELEVNTGNEEADAAFQTFYDAVKYMDGNSKFDNFYLTYKAYEKLHAEQYAKICDSTEAEWTSKTNFEKFIWYETYVRIVESMLVSNYDRFFGSEINFISNTIDNAYRDLNTYGDGTEAEAYKTLMLWQYAYIKENGIPYNFLTGLNYIESNDNAVLPNPEQEEKEQAEQEQKEIEEARQALVTEAGQNEQVQRDIEEISQEVTQENTAPGTAAKGGLWETIKKNAWLFVIALLLCGGGIGVIIYRKNKT